MFVHFIIYARTNDEVVELFAHILKKSTKKIFFNIHETHNDELSIG